jgi:hypothetical protein
MGRSLENIEATAVVSLADLGLDQQAGIDDAVAGFLRIAEAETTARWVQFPRGLLLFVFAPGDAESGEFYLYDRRRGVFYLLTLRGDCRYGGYRMEDYDELVRKHRLYDLAQRPGLVAAGGRVQ